MVSAPRESFHLHVAAGRRAAPEARAFVCAHAGGLGEADRQALELLTSELVTNAVLHARTPVRLGLTLADDELLVVVHDEASVMPEQQPYTNEEVGGRGLALVADLADAWGVVADDDGKAVWFCLRAAGAGSRWEGRGGR